MKNIKEVSIKIDQNSLKNLAERRFSEVNEVRQLSFPTKQNVTPFYFVQKESHNFPETVKHDRVIDQQDNSVTVRIMSEHHPQRGLHEVQVHVPVTESFEIEHCRELSVPRPVCDPGESLERPNSMPLDAISVSVIFVVVSDAEINHRPASCIWFAEDLAAAGRLFCLDVLVVVSVGQVVDFVFGPPYECLSEVLVRCLNVTMLSYESFQCEISHLKICFLFKSNNFCIF